MTILYLIESSDLNGGVRVVFDQARALRKRGHRVFIRSLRGDHRWYPYPITLEYVSAFASGDAVRPDVVIATFWTTVRPALEIESGLRLHLCQGYEGDITEYASIRHDIEAVYRIPIPKITVGEWLTDRLQRLFGKGGFQTYTIGQIVDLGLFHPLPFWRELFSRTLTSQKRVLICGLYESSVKGIPYAVKAVATLRARGLAVRLIRVSTGELSREETAITHIDEYYANIPSAAMAKLYQSSDLFIAPSLSHEGFGLPFAEALACGVPAVATAIPSHLSFDRSHDYARFVPERDPASIAEASTEIFRDRQLRDRLKKRGPELVHHQFRSESVAARLESLFSRLVQ
ncbi:MAG: glycosyltransferase family 4 protein [Thermodesulfovibrionales bacterium]|jgi:glycosyltransferase involved in cell wall biosynthesis